MDIEKGEEGHVKGIRNIFNKIHIRKIFKFRKKNGHPDLLQKVF